MLGLTFSPGNNWLHWESAPPLAGASGLPVPHNLHHSLSPPKVRLNVAIGQFSHRVAFLTMKWKVWDLYVLSNENTGLEAGVCFGKSSYTQPHPSFIVITAQLLRVFAFVGPALSLERQIVLWLISIAKNSTWQSPLWNINALHWAQWIHLGNTPTRLVHELLGLHEQEFCNLLNGVCSKAPWTLSRKKKFYLFCFFH